MKITNYQEALHYLDSYVPPTSSWGEPSYAHQRSIYLMDQLGNPQNKLKVIHIAGTSGKGSTAYMTTAALHSQGLHVGLAVSPHIINLLERIQIDTQMISEQMFCHYLNEIIPQLEEMKKSDYEQPTFFEIMIALSFYIFQKKGVDVAVIETGLGGRWDASNTIERDDKIAVISRIGYDHMEYLGHTLKEIVTEKSKIIHSRNHVITLDQDEEVLGVIKKETEIQKADLTILKAEQYSSIKVSHDYTQFNYSFENYHLEDIRTSLIGTYQAENAALALTSAIVFFKQENIGIDMQKLNDSLTRIQIPGRMEMKEWKSKKYILDGAHNPQKMHAFITSLTQIYSHNRFTFIISLKKGKEYAAIVREMIPYAKKIIITEFHNDAQGWKIEAEKAEVLAEILKKEGFHAIIIEKNVEKAISQESDGSPLIITGSFYLLGQVEPLIT